MANKIQIVADLRDDVSSRLDKVSNSVQKAARDIVTLGPVFNQVSMFAAQAVEKMARLPFEYAAQAEALGKLKTATQLSYSELQMLQQALEEAGSSPEALNQAVRILSTNLARGDKTLKSYGITATTTFDAILQVGRKLATESDGFRKADLAMAAFGRSSQDLVDTVSKFATDDNFRKGLATVTLSDKEVADFQKLDERLDLLGRKWKRVLNDIAGAMAPILVGVADLQLSEGAGDNYRRRLKSGKLFTTDPVDASFYDFSEQWKFSPTKAATRPTGTSTPRDPLRAFVPNYGYGPPLRQGGGYTSFGGVGLGGFGGMIDRASNAVRMFGGGESGGSWPDKTVESVKRMSAGVDNAFTSLFSRILAVQSHSNNLIVNLFADLANSILNEVASRAGSAIGGFFVDTLLSFVPGGGVLKHAAGKATAGPTVVVNTIETRSLVDAALNPMGPFRLQQMRLAQRSAVQ